MTSPGIQRIKSRNHTICSVIALSAFAMTPSCGAPADDLATKSGDEEATRTEAPEEVGSSQQALLGGLDFATSISGYTSDQAHVCNLLERQGLVQNAILARTVVRSQAFAECVTQVVARNVQLGDVAGGMGPYARCKGDPSGANATTILAAARNPRPVKVVCTGRGGLTHVGSGTGTYDFIGMGPTWNDDILSEPDFRTRTLQIAEASDTFVHETLHTWGYLDGTTCTNFFQQTASYIVGACVQQVVKESLNRCDVQSCPNAAELKLINGFPLANASTGELASSVGCACVRDNPGPVQTSIPASPRLGTNNADDSYGTSTAAGDFNGDGFQDLAVGAPGDAAGQGRVYLYRGTAFGLYPWKVLSQGGTADEAGDQFGFSVAAGKLDGDSFDDLAVGIPGEDNSAGAVLVFRGGSTDVTSARRIVETSFDTPEAGDQFGISLAIGHFYDQTWSAIAIGAHGERVFDKTNGMLWVFQGSSDVSGSMPLTPVAYSYDQNATDTGAYGFALASAKLDSDLFDDLVVGDPLRNGNAGSIYVIHGRDIRGFWSGDTLVESPLGKGTTQFFGYSVAVNSIMSASTISVGAPLSDAGRGRAYLFTDTRSTGGNISLWNSLLGNIEGGHFGIRLGAGRTPDELLIGASDQGGGLVGALRRTWQGSTPTVTWGQILVQNDVAETGDKFGQALAVGDFDGDGDRDLAVGSPGEGLAGSPANSGAVSLFRTDTSGTLVSWGVAHQAL